VFFVAVFFMFSVFLAINGGDHEVTFQIVKSLRIGMIIPSPKVFSQIFHLFPLKP